MTLALIIGLSLGFVSILFSRLLKQVDARYSIQAIEYSNKKTLSIICSLSH